MALLHLVIGCAASANEVSGASFAYEVLPILSDKCFLCHGPDETTREAGLRLNTEEGVREAFAGGDFDTSEAWRRIHLNNDEKMPPDELGKPLSKEEIATLKDWMESGAPWSGHWAFERIERPEVPDIKAGTNPIDAFIQQRLELKGWQANGRAAWETLARRASLDLTGLPPSPEDSRVFLENASEDAWEKYLGRLLASPHYAERMAVDWLDGARYADTNGYQNDFRRHMWPWRDWVIEAFARNMPFDQFTVEQLAGDLLPSPTDSQRIATGFNRNNRTVTEAGSLPEEWLVENVIDRVETTGAVFLGLTVGCARCHDHKYDPVSQQDFYSLFAFFHNVKEKGVHTEKRGNMPPLMHVVEEDERGTHHALQAAVQVATAAAKQAESRGYEAVEPWRQQLASPSAVVVPAPAASIALAKSLAATSITGDVVQAIPIGGKTPEFVGSLFRSAAKFDGMTWLEYPGLFAPASGKPFTVSAWVRRERAGALVTKIVRRRDKHRGFDMLLDASGRLMVHLISSWPEDAMKVSTVEPLPLKQWTHLSFTYDGTRKGAGVKIFFNGRQVETKIDHDQLSGEIDNDSPVRVGRRAEGGIFRGLMAGVAFHEEALSAEQIRAVALAHAVGEQGVLPGKGAVAAHGDELLGLYAGLSDDQPAVDLRSAHTRRLVAKKELDAFEADKPTVMIMEELPTPRDTYVLMRGEYDKPDKEQKVTSAAPGFLGGLPDGAPRNRLGLAEWLVARDNPLTARVVVNRLWAQFFGVGLVKTVEDFGLQGEPPSHPELLDWLAVEFIESGWDLQHMIRVIATSEAYRRSSIATAEQVALDPKNRMLARGPRRRLQAEFIRDNALAISGLLNRKVGGPSVFPYQPDGLWAELAGGASQGPYTLSKGGDLYRRSLYTFRKRTVPHPTMSTFDAPG
ncbi:MAG: DUF1549 domain-containing protein, partial [Planctomycetota bacterium]